MASRPPPSGANACNRGLAKVSAAQIPAQRIGQLTIQREKTSKVTYMKTVPHGHSGVQIFQPAGVVERLDHEAKGDPLAYFPWRLPGHYTAEGYALLARQIIDEVEELRGHRSP